MTTAERWRLITAVVERRTFVSVNDLSQLCRVSEVTIRRDLQALHDQGRLQRAYGGAAAPAPAAISGAPSSLADAAGVKANYCWNWVAVPVTVGGSQRARITVNVRKDTSFSGYPETPMVQIVDALYDGANIDTDTLLTNSMADTQDTDRKSVV